jgi:hypothetical protein
MIDLYCERIGPGLWAEPLNALTNLAFLAVALLSWQLARRSGGLTGSVAVLIAIIATIGIGSTLFHTLATRWAWWLDILPILVFQLWFLWLYLHYVASWRPASATAAVAAFLLAAIMARQFPEVLNRSLMYAPALLVLWMLGAYHARTAKRQPLALLVVGGVFTLSLLFRTIDETVCPYLPFGTHFLWHVLMAVVVYSAFRGLVANWPRASAGIAEVKAP